MIAPSSKRPNPRDLDLIFEKIRPQLDELLWRHGFVPEKATEMIREAVVALTHRWSRVRNREQWLLDRVEKAVRRSVSASSKAP